MTSNHLYSFLNIANGGTLATDALTSKLQDIKSGFTLLETAVTLEGLPRISELQDRFDKFVPRVSFIGQVKAGKTALVNGLLGTHGLLPSDVNPWTSVVTSMHVNVDQQNGKRAVFKFFNEDDWASLVSDGGRIAELARKAKFDTKLDELTEQIKEMKRRTEVRLGKNFEFLLGNKHSFSEYDTDLIKRYVCLGEEDMLSEKEGRFADLTKSADIYLATDRFPYPITIADTPGVNDPFLIREAATLSTLGTSDICVVVLSAHQALSSVDVGLIRILGSLQSEQIIVFVNRIDELPDPDTQIKEIESYISDMLRQQGLPSDVPVIFGSAVWAEAAMAGTLDNLTADALESLERLVDSRKARLQAGASDFGNVDNLLDVSGISALRAVLDVNVTKEVFAPVIADLSSQAITVAEQSAAYLRQTALADDIQIDTSDLNDATKMIKELERQIANETASKKSTFSEEMNFRIAGAYREFIETEKRSLRHHLDSKIPLDEWAPDTQKLRGSLNAAYGDFSNGASGFFDDVTQELTENLSAKLIPLFGKEVGASAPTIRKPSTPVSLMRTLTVDFSSGIVTGWFRRKLKKESFLSEFEELALADMRDTLSEINEDNLVSYFESSGQTIRDFLHGHLAALEQLGQLTDSERRRELRARFGGDSELETRLENISSAIELLNHTGSFVSEAQK